MLPPGLSYRQRKKFLFDAKYYPWEEPLLYKLYGDGIYKRCLPEDEVHSVLHHCDASTYGGHFGSDKTITKILQVGFYWPTLFKDKRKSIMSLISKRHEMPQSGILEVELFDVWGMNFRGPFPHSHNNLYIRVVVDYVFK